MKLNPNVQGHKWPDELYEMGVYYLKNNKIPNNLKTRDYHIQRTFKKRMSFYDINDNDKLIYKHKITSLWNPFVNDEKIYIVVKESEKKQVIDMYMNDPKLCVLGIHSMYDKIKDVYLGISRSDVKDILKDNNALAISMTANKKPIVKSFRPLYPFQHWQMDLIVLDRDEIKQANTYKSVQYGYILVIVDIFSKYTYIYPLKDRKGSTISKWLTKLFLSGDIPHILHSDNGPEFDNADVKSVCEQFNIRILFGPAHNPQTQGFVENKNKQIKRILNYFFIKYNTYKYFDILERVSFSLNNTKNSVTGYTPMQIHRGRQIMLRNPFQDIEDIKFDYNSNIDYPQYIKDITQLNEKQVEIVKNNISKVADKREAKELQLRNEFNLHDIVQILAYTSDSSGITPIQISKKIDNVYEQIDNPLKTKDNVTIKDLSTYKILSKAMLNKNKVFNVKYQIIEKNSKEKYYKVISYPDRYYKLYRITKIKESKTYYSDFFYGSQLVKATLDDTKNDSKMFYIDPFEIDESNIEKKDKYDLIKSINDIDKRFVYKEFFDSYKNNDNTVINLETKSEYKGKINILSNSIQIVYEDGWNESVKNLKEFKMLLLNKTYVLASKYVFTNLEVQAILQDERIYSKMNILIVFEVPDVRIAVRYVNKSGIILEKSNEYYKVIFEKEGIKELKLDYKKYNKMSNKNGWTVFGDYEVQRIRNKLTI